MRKQLTGEPVAGELHTGFGGRGRRQPFPTPILGHIWVTRLRLEKSGSATDFPHSPINLSTVYLHERH